MSSERLYVGRDDEVNVQATTAGRLTGDLPTDVATTAARRVGVLALLMIVVAVWGMFQTHVLLPLTGIEDHGARRGARLVLLGASLAVAYVSWRGVVPPHRVLRIGLWYELLLCFVLSLVSNIRGYPDDISLHGLPPVAGLILIAPLLVPVAWRLRLVTTTACAALFPITMLLVGALGGPAPPVGDAVLLVSTVFVCAFLALVAARVIGKMTERLLEARRAVREMGSYRMVERLGAGGMGEVWRAEHRMLARPAAIKLIRAENLSGSDDDRKRLALARFEREAKATAALTSPHTVQVFDFGITDDGAFYYVMELLDGRDLQDVVASHGALPVERAVHVLSQACESLAEAHRRGLVHRDVKPGNVMLCRLGERHDFVKVVDFGLVQDRSAENASSEGRLTLDGAVVGTPTFMPPEMALDAASADARADVYALGCLAWVMLAGRPPFVGATVMETILQHVREPAPALIDHAMVPIPLELDALVNGCLAKSPDDRPADAAALLALLDGIPLAEPWTEPRAAAWWRENG